jgi:YVTN family beta-propeller protein
MILGNAISVDCGAFRIAASPSGRWLYLPNATRNSVSIVHTGRKAVTTTLPFGSEDEPTLPFGVALTPDGGRALVTKLGASFGPARTGIAFINTRTNNLLGISLNTLGRPFEIAVNPDGKWAYAATFNGMGIMVLDLNNNTVIKTIPAGPRTWSMASSPDGQRLYAVDPADNLLRVIDTATNTITMSVPAGSAPNAVAISPDGSRLYIVHRSGQEGLWVINTATLQLITKIPTGADVTADDPGRLAISPDGTLAYVANRNTNDVTAIDLRTNTVLRRIRLLVSPLSVIFVTQPTEVTEREPNDEATQANPISPASVLVVKGAINRAGDIDVFAFDGRAGQRLILDSDAQTLGSQTDTVLTVLDSTGAMLAENNDFDGSRDSYLTFTIPSDGKYFLSVKSANPRQGGANVLYEIVITLR